ncbi:MAG: flagellar biosynthesis anti-sigma factor FlgM [Candidatus Sulfotelmatobacter sp.]
MRIDLNYAAQAAPESDRTRPRSTTAAGNPSAAKTVSGADQAQLSGAHTQVEALAAQASQLPEAREQRVQALRLAVDRGQYQPDPQKVAGALVAHMMLVPAVHG